MTNVTTYSNQPIPSYSGVTINVTNPAMTVAPNIPQAYNNFSDQNGYNIGQPIVMQPQLQQQPPSYPAQYYMNNYNYPDSGICQPNQNTNLLPLSTQTSSVPVVKEENTDTSKEIISDLEQRADEIKEAQKNAKQKKVVTLTNEYIMSLENYLNNPNTDIRLMASKEILTRLDEDKTRYDDAALNALLNKMLQDPSKLVRVAALSALSSGLASGNDYTFELLNNIQNDPNADPEDVLEVSQILLKHSTSTEVKYLPPETDIE